MQGIIRKMIRKALEAQNTDVNPVKKKRGQQVVIMEMPCDV